MHGSGGTTISRRPPRSHSEVSPSLSRRSRRSWSRSKTSVSSRPTLFAPAGPAWGIGPQPPAARCAGVSAEQAPSPAVRTRSLSRHLPYWTHGVALVVTNPEATRSWQQLVLAGAHDKRANPDLTRRNGIEDSIDATAGIFVRRPVRNASNSLMSLTATLSR